MIAHCTCTALGIKRTASAANKKEARRKASAMVIQELVLQGGATKKQCPVCHDEKFLREYPLDPKCEDGHRTICTACDGKARENRKAMYEALPSLRDLAVPAMASGVGVVEDVPLKTKKEIIVLHEQGMTIADIAAQVRLTPAMVSRALYG